MRFHNPVIRVIALIVCPLLLIVGVSLVLAQQFIQPDRRLNQIAHFGGDAFYCVNDDRNPTTEFPEIGSVGFRLLNKDGQELWYVPAEAVATVLAQIIPGNAAILIATGNGTYGPTAIYGEIQLDGRRFFTFTGFDEHGKSNSLKFEDCTPVGSAVLMDTATPTATLASEATLVPGEPTSTPSITPTDGPTPTASSTATATDTLTPTDTSTATDTLTPTDTSTATDTLTPTDTPTATDTASPVPS